MSEVLCDSFLLIVPVFFFLRQWTEREKKEVMVVYRLSGTTSLLPNNLIIFGENEEQQLPIVATRNAVLVGEKSRVKIETG